MHGPRIIPYGGIVATGGYVPSPEQIEIPSLKAQVAQLTEERDALKEELEIRTRNLDKFQEKWIQAANQLAEARSALQGKDE